MFHYHINSLHNFYKLIPSRFYHNLFVHYMQKNFYVLPLRNNLISLSVVFLLDLLYFQYSNVAFSTYPFILLFYILLFYSLKRCQ